MYCRGLLFHTLRKIAATIARIYGGSAYLDPEISEAQEVYFEVIEKGVEGVESL